MGNKWLFLIFQRDYDYDYLCFQVMSINIKKLPNFSSTCIQKQLLIFLFK